MAQFMGDGKAIILVLIGAIISITLLASFAEQIFIETNTFTIVNSTITVGIVNSTTDLTGRELFSGGTERIVNETGVITNLGISLQTGTSSTTGLRTVQVFVNDTGSGFTGNLSNLTYDYIPDGYIGTAGGRSIANLIPIFAALAIVIFVIVIFIKNGSMGRLMGRPNS